MGSLNPLAKPKMPKPVVVSPPPVATQDPNASMAEAEAERKRRAAATGSSGNILSSLASATPDALAQSRKTLLGG